MNAAEVLASSLAPGSDRVYFLGCFESRVTVYAQQVRALNLVSALVGEGKIRSTGKIAIIGGGAAGMTAAAAVVALRPDLQKLVLFERKPDLLHMQMQSRDRYLHPHIYDWPRNGSLQSNAGLPLLDWEADSADVVAKTLEHRFQSFQEAPCVEVRTSTSVAGISILGSGCRVGLENGGVDQTVFDAAILSVGFGYERFTELRQASYWDVSPLAQPMRNPLVDPEIFVSGNGDGALVDFSLAAYNHLSHLNLCQFIVGSPDIEAAKAELLVIEAEAEAQGDAYDIWAAYTDRLSGLIPNGMWLDVYEKLRIDARVRFHTRSDLLFRRDTSILNRFMAYLAIRSDETNNPDARRITVTTGKPLLPPAWTDDGSIHIQDEPAFKPFSRFLRFGADKERVLAPFEPLAQAAQVAHAALPNTHASATPSLIDTAREHYENLKHDPRFIRLTIVQAESHAATLATRRLELRRYGDQIRWCGEQLAALQSIWDAQKLEIRCDFLPRDTPRLSTALFRLMAHAENSELSSFGKNEWQRTWRETMTPGPSLSTRYGNPIFSAADQTMLLVNTPELISQIDLASKINECLDQITVVRLNRMVTGCLDDVTPQPFGWDIAQTLRKRLLERWAVWLTALQANPAALRRFLVLMAAEKDVADFPDDTLLRVGCHTLQGTILRSTLFALHVAEALPDSLSPDPQFPGNLGNRIFRAHACGVSWIDGIDIRSSFKKIAWSSRLVLLSELESPSLLANRRVPRLTEGEEEAPSLMDESLLEAPIIIGSDDSFRFAASVGKQRLESHFSAIFTQLTVEADSSLER